MPGILTSATTTSATAPRGKCQRSLQLAMVAPMKNPSRERLKSELTFLRSHFGALEAHLHALQRQQRQHYCHGGRGTAMVGPEHERDRRRTSERENRRLRALLWHQIHTGRLHIAALTGQTPEMLGGGALFSLAPLRVRHACQLHDGHGQRFTLLRNDVDRAFTFLDDVFATDDHGTTRHSSFTTMVQSRVFGQREQQLVTEERKSGVTEFDLSRCGTALWDAIGPAAFGLWDAEVRSAGTDVKISRLRTRHVLQGTAVELAASIVVKRFVSADRTVVVWRAVTSSDAIDCDAYIDETGWTLYTREQAETDIGSGVETTRKRTCVQWVPRAVAQGRGSDCAVALAPKTRGLTKLVHALWANETQSIGELMENLLIEDCMRDAESPSPTNSTASMSSGSGSGRGRSNGSRSGSMSSRRSGSSTEFSLPGSSSCRETAYDLVL